MSKSSLITIRIEPDIKADAERLYVSFGLNLSDAINMFIHQSLLMNGLPFELRNPEFNEKNKKRMMNDANVVIDYCDAIEHDLSLCNNDYETYLTNGYVQRSCGFSLYMIGEVSRNLSDVLKDKCREIDWSTFERYEDITVIDDNLLRSKAFWQMLTEDVPELKMCLEKLF